MAEKACMAAIAELPNYIEATYGPLKGEDDRYYPSYCPTYNKIKNSYDYVTIINSAYYSSNELVDLDDISFSAPPVIVPDHLELDISYEFNMSYHSFAIDEQYENYAAIATTVHLWNTSKGVDVYVTSGQQYTPGNPPTTYIFDSLPSSYSAFLAGDNTFNGIYEGESLNNNSSGLNYMETVWCAPDGYLNDSTMHVELIDFVVFFPGKVRIGFESDGKTPIYELSYDDDKIITYSDTNTMRIYFNDNYSEIEQPNHESHCMLNLRFDGYKAPEAYQTHTRIPSHQL